MNLLEQARASWIPPRPCSIATSLSRKPIARRHRRSIHFLSHSGPTLASLKDLKPTNFWHGTLGAIFDFFLGLLIPHITMWFFCSASRVLPPSSLILLHHLTFTPVAVPRGRRGGTWWTWWLSRPPVSCGMCSLGPARLFVVADALSAVVVAAVAAVSCGRRSTWLSRLSVGVAAWAIQLTWWLPQLFRAAGAALGDSPDCLAAGVAAWAASVYRSIDLWIYIDLSIDLSICPSLEPSAFKPICLIFLSSPSDHHPLPPS